MRVLRDNNIIHRDLKPQNVLLHNPNGSLHYYDLTLKLADFGLARFLDDSTKISESPQSLCGTLAYVAPEILRAWTSGRCYGKYTAKVDLWSIGMILYECLTGELADLDPVST
ncbi:Ulk1 protein [Aphelenchoides avenae]|nr:Ulk1 protein [Aphelenchus avenae]